MRSINYLACGVMLCLGAGCATATRGVNLESLRGVREERFPQVGRWEIGDGSIRNAIPPDASPDDVFNCRGGIGVSMGLVPGLCARDLDAESRISFQQKGAPSIVFRTQEKDGVVHSMYSLVIYHGGINLWRLLDGKWTAVVRHKQPLAEDVPYLLHAVVLNDKIDVYLDGVKAFEASDEALMEPGGAGVCGMEGPCRFYSLRVRQLDERGMRK